MKLTVCVLWQYVAEYTHKTDDSESKKSFAGLASVRRVNSVCARRISWKSLRLAVCIMAVFTNRWKVRWDRKTVVDPDKLLSVGVPFELVQHVDGRHN